MKQTFNQYIGRAARHLVKLVVIIAVIFAVMYFTDTLAISLSELVSWRGAVLLIALVGISAAYPLYGFGSYIVQGSLTADRGAIEQALSACQYAPTEEREGVIVCRATTLWRRVRNVGDDAIVLRQVGANSIEISGQRREAEQLRFTIGGYRNLAGGNE